MTEYYINFENKEQEDAAIAALECLRDINDGMSADSAVEFDERVELIGELAASTVAIFILKNDPSQRLVDGGRRVSFPSDAYGAVCKAINIYCNQYSDDFESEPVTPQRVDMLIALNRLDVRLN